MADPDGVRKLIAEMRELSSDMKNWASSTQEVIGPQVKNACAIVHGDTAQFTANCDNLTRGVTDSGSFLDELAGRLDSIVNTVQAADNRQRNPRPLH
jgi:hypothetical protein